MLRKISVDLSLYNDVLVQAGMKVLMYINMSSSLGHVSLFQTYSVLFIWEQKTTALDIVYEPPTVTLTSKRNYVRVMDETHRWEKVHR